MRVSRPPARDAGFTLIELLVVTVLLGLITVPLGNAIIGYLRDSDAAGDRMALSHDAQISAAYLARDVAAVGLRDTTASTAGGSIPFKASIQLAAAYDAGGLVCGTAATPNAQIRLLSDDWAIAAPHDHSTRIVAYYLAGTELHRLLCAGGTTTDVMLAHNVDPATFVVTCAGPSTCDGTSAPQTVTIAFSVSLPAAGAYPITLTGHRRQQ